jgi:hypothetical protein
MSLEMKEERKEKSRKSVPREERENGRGTHAYYATLPPSHNTIICNGILLFGGVLIPLRLQQKSVLVCERESCTPPSVIASV